MPRDSNDNNENGVRSPGYQAGDEEAVVVMPVSSDGRMKPHSRWEVPASNSSSKNPGPTNLLTVGLRADSSSFLGHGCHICQVEIFTHLFDHSTNIYRSPVVWRECSTIQGLQC